MDKDRENMQKEADRLLTHGAIGPAILAHQQLLSAYPEVANGWYNLGYLFRCARRFKAAICAYEQALERGISKQEEVYLNIAAIYSEHLNQLSMARKKLNCALDVNPNFIPAWLNMGNLEEDLGNVAAAKHAYSNAVLSESHNGRALARFAILDASEGNGEFQIRKLEAICLHPMLPRSELATILFALGLLYDSIGAYDRAFECVVQANSIVAQSRPPVLRYDVDTQSQFIDACIEANPIGKINTAARHQTAPTPLFICGMFRSGSTLVERMLSKHSMISACGELEIVPHMVEAELQPYPQSLNSLSEKSLNLMQSDYLSQVTSVYQIKNIFTDKRPDNFVHVGLIKRIFPNCKIIITNRNIFDNAISLYFGDFDPSVSYTNDFQNIFSYYKNFVRILEHWKALYAADIHDVDYDQFVAEPEREMRKLVNFCGLDWESQCCENPVDGEPVQTMSAWDVRKPVHTRSTGRWRNYEHLVGFGRTTEGFAIADPNYNNERSC
jgi:tetratricopeptide (TPR) repeat protein